LSNWLSDTEADVKQGDADVGNPTQSEAITTQRESSTSSISRPGASEIKVLMSSMLMILEHNRELRHQNGRSGRFTGLQCPVCLCRFSQPKMLIDFDVNTSCEHLVEQG
jgi:hypothetical protein